MTARSDASPATFKQALEQRLQAASKDGVDFARRRQRLIFDRFLARACAVLGKSVLVKGGLVLELRLERVRTTNDVDLRAAGSPTKLLASLQEAGRQDLGDCMTFEVHSDAERPTIENDGMPYDGQRFRAECRLAGQSYGQRFGLDVGFGDRILGVPDVAIADDLLDFAGIAPPVLQLYPIETHVAETLHAYTMPRAGTTPRIKDLPDIALLAGIRSIDAERLRSAFEQTFTHRATHPLPKAMPDPPTSWSVPYQQMARENDLSWPTLERLTAVAAAFLNPVLAGRTGVWHPDRWIWD